jgi:metallo-beta-lactamase class B
MLKTLITGVALSVLAAVAAHAAAAPGAPRELPTPEEWANMGPAAKAYVDKARQLAGNDPDLQFDFNIFCQASGGAQGRDRASLGVPASEPRLQPYPAPNPKVSLGGQRLADNLYWFGDTGVGAFLVVGSDGYILLDALNNMEEARDVLVPSMRKFGLDPARIKYMVFGHYHLDHTGGGQYIQANYKPKVIMGRDDWPLYFRSLQSNTGQAARLTDKTPMTRDMDAVDGMKIAVGDVTATVFQMTGHTPGSIGMVVPVKDKGVTKNVLFITAGSDISNRNAFIGGYEHIWDEAIKMDAESVMQVHPNTNMNILARTKYVSDAYAAGRAPERNPLFYGKERTARYLNIVRACTQARMEILGW